MAKGVYFNGRWITKPGAYGSIDADQMTSMSTGSPRILALVGPSTGGVPNEIMWFDNPTSAKKVLKDGYLMKACEKAWSPANKGGGAQLIGVIRANKATQSSLVIGDGIPVLSNISTPIAGIGNMSTGVVTTLGTYTGTVNKDLIILIDSETTNDETSFTFKWKYKSDEDWRQSAVTSAQSGNSVILVDGIEVRFGVGNYVYADSFTIKAVSEKLESEAIKITSKDSGEWTNKIQAKQESGVLDGTKCITLFYWEKNQYEVYNNLGAMAYLNYTGSQPYAVVEITKDQNGNADKLITRIGADEASSIIDLEIDLSDDRFKQVKQLTEYISGYENYVCEFYSLANQTLGATDLDTVKTSIKTEVLLTAYWADLTKTITSKSDFVSIERVDMSSKTPEDFDYISLTGGSEGVMPSSWVEYFDKFGAHPITYLVPVTSDKSIHAEARAHVDYMSNTMGRERFLICGGAAGETVADAKKRASSHNSDRTQIVYPGFYDYDATGALTLYPAFITASMFAGRDCFLGSGESSTFNYFDVEALEFELEPLAVNELLNAGVAPLEFIMGKGNRLVQDITSYTQGDMSLYTERSVRVLADNLNKELREKIELAIIGKKGSRTPLTSVKNLVISFLKQKVKSEEILAYKDVRITYASRVLNVEYSVAPVEPVNFALITGHFYTEEITL